jgi:NAD(P)-dependent dehydrogenase (short-subunit alcohol dehydrogenase family)
VLLLLFGSAKPKSSLFPGSPQALITAASSTSGPATQPTKIAPQFLVEVLAKEIGQRGVAVNSILPTAIEGAGVFTGGVNAEFKNFIESFRPMQRWAGASLVFAPLVWFS